MASTFRALLLVSLALTAAPTLCPAQDVKDEGAKPAPAPQPAAETADAGALLRKMEFLYPKAIQRPTTDGQTTDPKLLAERAKAHDVWDTAVRLLAKTGDEYMTAIGDAAPDARALYFRGVAKTIAGEIVGAGERRACYAAASDSLTRYLDGTDEKAPYRVEAEMYLGRSLVFEGRLDDAVVHLRKAVDLLQKEGRHEEAGVSAYLALIGLQSKGRDAEMRAFAEAIHAGDGDFGGATSTIRGLLAAARLAVGSPLPALPAAKDVDDKPVVFVERGAPLLLHFFLTAQITGDATSFKDVDTVIRPLWEKWREKGLRVVGTCMDRAIPPAEAERIRKNWEEWGKKTEFRDGSLETSRAWAKAHGIEWTWRWTGTWTNDPVSRALGGVGGTSPYAVLVDKDGIVRWKGDPLKDEGLADEAAKLFK